MGNTGRTFNICTAQDPWKPGIEHCSHPDAVEFGEQQDGYPGGDIQAYKCPPCGTIFKEELPQ